MMTGKLRLILLIGLILMLVLITREVRRRHIELKYTLSWYFLDVVIMLLVIFPTLPRKIAKLIGIYSEMNMIFFAGFLFSLIIIYTLTVAVSKLSNQVRDLTQRIAIYENKEEE